MKINLNVFFFIVFALFSKILEASELNIISDNIKILEDGRIVKSINTQAYIEKKRFVY